MISDLGNLLPNPVLPVLGETVEGGLGISDLGKLLPDPVLPVLGMTAGSGPGEAVGEPVAGYGSVSFGAGYGSGDDADELVGFREQRRNPVGRSQAAFLYEFQPELALVCFFQHNAELGDGLCS